MPPQSASKQKRLAEKAAKQSAKQKGTVSSTTTSTPTGSINGSSVNTPLTSVAGSTEDLNAMEKLKLATERQADSFQISDSPLTRGSQECRWRLGL
jgi:ATP-binding cassette subfamily F protein 2